MGVLSSLRLRLVAALVIVALVPLGAAAVMIDRATTDAFRDYAREQDTVNAQSVANQLGAITGEDVTVRNEESGITVSSNDGAVNRTYDVSAGGATGESETGEERESYSVSLPGAADTTFLGDVDRALLLAVGIAAGSALLLATLLARSTVRPVERLTAAARGMSDGDLDLRVEVPSARELGMLADAFNAMAERRQELETQRRHLVNDVAHELRSPLANLQGYLELLRDGVIEPTPERLASLHDESLALNGLVKDLQELALLEAGQLPLRLEPTAIDRAISNAVEAQRPAALAVDVALLVSLDEALPPARVDPARFGQILRNLLRNAITHTRPGGEVEVSAADRGDVIEVAVRDTGVGIAAEQLPHVFDRFYRGDPARSRESGGSGLGLAVVKNLVEAQGGMVGVTSRPGHGSVFIFTLPAAV
jgi:signal transduction histidine kinase